MLQVMTTSKKYQLATKTKEEQQEWISTINKLIFGPPVWERTCKYQFQDHLFPIYTLSYNLYMKTPINRLSLLCPQFKLHNENTNQY